MLRSGVSPSRWQASTGRSAACRGGTLRCPPLRSGWLPGRRPAVCPAGHWSVSCSLFHLLFGGDVPVGLVVLAVITRVAVVTRMGESVVPSEAVSLDGCVAVNALHDSPPSSSFLNVVP